MIVKNPNNYDFVKFEKGNYPKKYNAILINKETRKLKRVPFGDQRYEHYKDTTDLKLYSNLDHKDKKRKERYYARHGTHAEAFSSKFFSHYFLWT